MPRNIGIDLGTYNSAVAFVNDHGGIEVIPSSEGAGKLTTPSVILCEESGEIIVGDTAKQNIVMEHKNVISYVKREVGVKILNDNNEQVDWKGPARTNKYTTVEAQSFILKKLKADAEQYMNDTVTEAVITVPAFFSLKQRKLVEQSAELAGLKVKRLINEPTAAAIAYGTQNLKESDTVLVFDLGGGTFDVSIIKFNTEHKEWEVLNNEGDPRLGGADWDEKIINHVAEEFENKFFDDPRQDPAVKQELFENAEKAKIQLSKKARNKIPCSYNGNSLPVEITRLKFEELTEDLLSSTIMKMEAAIKGAKLTKNDIDKVILVGASCNMPMTMWALKGDSDAYNDEEKKAKKDKGQTGFFEGTKAQVIKAPSLDLMVVRGAAMYDGVGDVLNHSIGVGALDESQKMINVHLLEKNSRLELKSYNTGDVNEVLSKDINSILQILVSPPNNGKGLFGGPPGAAYLRIPVYEGESKDPEACSLLGELIVQNLPTDRPNPSPIWIILQSTMNGTVEIEAIDILTKKRFQASIKLSGIKDENELLQQKQELDKVNVSS